MLRIELVKQPDGGTVLRCFRPDGSMTWQKQARHAAHFTLHDLTHYAVESVLGYQRGFFGLIAGGWDIADTTGKGKRGALPGESLEVESIVGLFDTERGSGVNWPLEQFKQSVSRELGEDQMQCMRTLRADLFRQWSEVQPGNKLELNFG